MVIIFSLALGIGSTIPGYDKDGWLLKLRLAVVSNAYSTNILFLMKNKTGYRFLTYKTSFFLKDLKNRISNDPDSKGFLR